MALDDQKHISWLASTMKSSSSLTKMIQKLDPETKQQIISAPTTQQVHDLMSKNENVRYYLHYVILPKSSNPIGLSYSSIRSCDLLDKPLDFTQKGKDHFEQGGWFVKLLQAPSSEKDQIYENMIDDFAFMEDFCSAFRLYLSRL
jgi:hypothetical protein